MSKLDEMPEWQIGWTAGMIDGEGCLYIRRKKDGYYSVAIQVTSTCYAAVAMLLNITGLGTIEQQKPYGVNKAKHKPCYRWTVYARLDIHTLASKIRPYLLIKREQADVMISFCEHHIAGKELGMLEQCRLKMKELNA